MSIQGPVKHPKLGAWMLDEHRVGRLSSLNLVKIVHVRQKWGPVTIAAPPPLPKVRRSWPPPVPTPMPQRRLHSTAKPYGVIRVIRKVGRSGKHCSLHTNTRTIRRIF